ncbi:MAG: NnrS family protein, partial [Caulobacteraceae bacterium]
MKLESRERDSLGPAILSAGFRPFFLLAALWGAVGIPLWLLAYTAGFIIPGGVPALFWHAHEMVFGFAAAAAAGFLLTAVANWTGRPAIRGAPLVALAALWAAGRAAMMLSGPIGAPVTAIADLSFLAALWVLLAREILSAGSWRNLPILCAVGALLAANLLFHLGELGVLSSPELGDRLGVAALLVMITLVGGRIIPAFTRNWLIKRNPAASPPAAEGVFDHAAAVVTAAAVLALAFAPDQRITAWLLVVAGEASALRLARWRGFAAFGEPLLFILHLGYAWLAAGLFLLGLDSITHFLPQADALHALTAGAIGIMILAVMTRVSLGHTGRPLAAGAGTCLAYGLVTLGAVLRVLSPAAGTETNLALAAAGTAWSAGFALFLGIYGPMLIRPRVP